MSELTPPFQANTNRPNPRLWWITAVLIALNVGLFLWQISTGVDASQPSSRDALLWGADYAPLSFLAEPFRLLSSMFFHFGLIHLMLNMWALYIFGSIAEQLLGRAYFFALYVFSGLMGSLLSGYIAIQNSITLLEQGTINSALMPSVSAGASGAVMGLGAALTILSLLPVLPRQRFILDKKTLLLVMGLNLMLGFMITGINNAAHIGGMIMGAVLAVLWYMAEKYRAAWLKAIGLLLAILGLYMFYQYCLSLVALILPFWSEVLQMMQQHLGLS